MKDFVWSGSGVSARAAGFWAADFFSSSSNTCVQRLTIMLPCVTGLSIALDFVRCFIYNKWVGVVVIAFLS